MIRRAPHHSRRAAACALVVLCLLLGGCATTRSELRVAAPTDTGGETVANAELPTLFLREVVDQRVFEEAPKDPSIPSLGFGGAMSATAEVKARAIGRKRDTWGKAMGDILLEEGQTVEHLVRDTVAAGLRQAGYTLSETADNGAISVDVAILKFWSWFQPGFWALTLHANIHIEMNWAGRNEALQFTIAAQQSRQLATDGA
jgi:hypothetical protein